MNFPLQTVKMAHEAPIKEILKFDAPKTSKIKVNLKDEDDNEAKEHIPAFNG